MASDRPSRHNLYACRRCENAMPVCGTAPCAPGAEPETTERRGLILDCLSAMGNRWQVPGMWVARHGSNEICRNSINYCKSCARIGVTFCNGTYFVDGRLNRGGMDLNNGIYRRLTQMNHAVYAPRPFTLLVGWRIRAAH